MLIFGFITAALLVGSVGYALTPDPVEDALDDDSDAVSGLGDGDDNVTGTDGIDQLFGEDGDDLIAAEDSLDTVEGGDGDDALVGGAGSDEVRGGNGNDIVSTGTGNDAGFGDAGDDVVQGGDGNDWLSGGEGNDFVKGDAGSDTIFGGLGNDILRGGQGDDLLVGAEIFREDHDEAFGVNLTMQNTVLYDTDIDDEDAMNGDEGNDTFLLGKGDYAIGGEGDDSYLIGIWAKGEPAFIEDFNAEREAITISVNAGEPLPTIGFDIVGTDAVMTMDGEPLLVLIGNATAVDFIDYSFSTDVFDTRPDPAA